MDGGKTAARAALFAAGFGCLWYAGLAPMPDGGELSFASLALRLVQGAVIAVLGIVAAARRASGCTGALPAGAIALFCLVIFAGEAGLPEAARMLDRLFYGTLFFCWLSVSLSRNRALPDGAIPAAFLVGSLLSFGGFLGLPLFTQAWREGFEALSLLFLVVYGYLERAEAPALPARLPEGAKASSLSPKAWALRYVVLLLGAAAFSFVFGTMTDLHGWMGDKEAVLVTQGANAAAALVLAVTFSVYRRPFRPDAAIALVVPLFAVAILVASAGEPDGGLSRLAIMVGYLVYWIVGWVFILREQRALGTSGMLALALLCAAMLAFGQIGRAVAQAVLAGGDMSRPEFSSLSLVLFWVMIVVATGAYWLARARAVNRDLALVEQAADAAAEGGAASPGDLGGEDGTAVRTGSAATEDASAAGSPLGESAVVVDRVALQAQALRTRIGLSARETEVVVEFARGRSAAVIAERLFVSPNTVKTHLRRIYEKAGIHSRQELLDLLDGTEK